MSWLFYAIICALAYGTEGAYVKAILKKELNEYLIVWGMFAFGIPFVAVPVLIKGCPQLDSTFWFSCFGAVIGYTIGFTLYVKAIKHTDVSLAVPLLSLSPVLLLLTSFVILGEFPSKPGLAGVALVTIGCYLLPAERGKSVLEPFLRIGRDKGCRFALATVLVWSIVANIDKIALRHSSPYVYPLIVHLLFSIIFFPIVLPWIKEIRNSSSMKRLAGVGFLQAVLMLSHMFALGLTLVPYLIAVKRSGMLVSVLLGWLFLGEKSGKKRMLAAAIIVCGLALIVLF